MRIIESDNKIITDVRNGYSPTNSIGYHQNRLVQLWVSSLVGHQDMLVYVGKYITNVKQSIVYAVFYCGECDEEYQLPKDTKHCPICSYPDLVEN